MSTKREQIMQAIQTRLTGLAGVTGVYRTREDAMAREESPAVALSWDDDRIREQFFDVIERDLSVLVGVYTRADVPDQAADAVVQQAYSLLLADTTLGGLAIDLSEDGTQFEAGDADMTAGWTTVRVKVWYRHSRSSLAA